MTGVEVMESITVIKDNYPPEQYSTLRKALDNAINVLELQIPRQVIKIDGVSSQACPTCKTNVNWNYCKNCGQKISY